MCREEIKGIWEKETVSAPESLRRNLAGALNGFQLIGKYFLKYYQKGQNISQRGRL